MSARNILLGKGTKLHISKLSACDRVFPPIVEITAEAAAANAETITVDFSPALDIAIIATEDNPVYLDFVEPNGKQHLVIVTDTIDAGATALTVRALPRDIGAGAVGSYPPVLSRRTDINLSTNDTDTEASTFDEEGWMDGAVTKLGQAISAPGHYTIAAGWETCLDCRLNLLEAYAIVVLPKKKCDNLYPHGHVFHGAVTVGSMPVESPNAGIIQGSIDLTFRGQVGVIKPWEVFPPVATPAPTPTPTP